MYIFKRREGRDEESKERRDDSNMLFILWATGRAQAYRTTFWLNLQHIKTEKHQNRTLTFEDYFYAYLSFEPRC